MVALLARWPACWLAWLLPGSFLVRRRCACGIFIAEWRAVYSGSDRALLNEQSSHLPLGSSLRHCLHPRLWNRLLVTEGTGAGCFFYFAAGKIKDRYY